MRWAVSRSPVIGSPCGLPIVEKPKSRSRSSGCARFNVSIAPVGIRSPSRLVEEDGDARETSFFASLELARPCSMVSKASVRALRPPRNLFEVSEIEALHARLVALKSSSRGSASETPRRLLAGPRDRMEAARAHVAVTCTECAGRRPAGRTPSRRRGASSAEAGRDEHEGTQNDAKGRTFPVHAGG